LGRFRGASMRVERGVGTGPNEDVYYARSMGWLDTPLRIWINAALLPDDPWYQAQRGRRPPRHPFGCGKEFVERMAAWVPSHEGQHYVIDRAYFQDTTTLKSLEATVGFGTSAPIQAELDSIYARRKVLQDSLDARDYGIQDCEPYPLPAP